jgi:hypothetical protein
MNATTARNPRNNQEITMRKQTFMIAAFVGILAAAAMLTPVQAQPGGGKKDKGGATETVDDFVKKMMAFNKAKDGKLTKAELNDKRLHGLFDRADTNKDGVVTREELEALFAKENVGGGAGGKGGGPGEKGGKGAKGKGGPQPGVILPAFVQDTLNLTESQRKQVADLQKEVDAKLNTILTEEQRTQLREMRANDKKDKKGPPGDK